MAQNGGGGHGKYFCSVLCNTSNRVTQVTKQHKQRGNTSNGVTQVLFKRGNTSNGKTQETG